MLGHRKQFELLMEDNERARTTPQSNKEYRYYCSITKALTASRAIILTNPKAIVWLILFPAECSISMYCLSPFFDPVELLERSSSSSTSGTCRRRRLWYASWASVALWCAIVIVSHGTFNTTTVSAFSVSPRGVTRVALTRTTTTALWDAPLPPSRRNNSKNNPAAPPINEPPSLVLDREQIEHQQKSKQRFNNKSSNTTERRGNPPPLPNPNMERFELKLAELKATDGKLLTRKFTVNGLSFFHKFMQ
jgi:hypothetical protein